MDAPRIWVYRLSLKKYVSCAAVGGIAARCPGSWQGPLEGSRQAHVFPSDNSTAASQQPGFILLQPATPLFVLWLLTYGSKL